MGGKNINPNTHGWVQYPINRKLWKRFRILCQMMDVKAEHQVQEAIRFYLETHAKTIAEKASATFTQLSTENQNGSGLDKDSQGDSVSLVMEEEAV